jgi:hypothetical protein
MGGEPDKAGKYQSEVVSAYNNCDIGSVTTQTTGSIPLPACVAVENAPLGCVLGPGSKGKIQAKAKDDISLKASIKGLTAACEGLTLALSTTMNLTTDDCLAGGRCTVLSAALDPFNLAVVGGTCLVEGGKCKIKTGVNEALPGTLIPGEQTSIEIKGVTLGISGGTAVLSAGILMP